MCVVCFGMKHSCYRQRESMPRVAQPSLVSTACSQVVVIHLCHCHLAEEHQCQEVWGGGEGAVERHRNTKAYRRESQVKRCSLLQIVCCRHEPCTCVSKCFLSHGDHMGLPKRHPDRKVCGLFAEQLRLGDAIVCRHCFSNSVSPHEERVPGSPVSRLRLALCLPGFFEFGARGHILLQAHSTA